MGFERHALTLIKYLSRRQNIGEVATIGRQSLDIKEEEFANHGLSRDEKFCESLIKLYGANNVESYDASDYEGATHVRDFNKKFDTHKKYDLVLDFGSLEHIWNQPAAFQNVINLAGLNGTICHILPANNLAGHGFWQYSSDLMYGIYSAENGFDGTEVYYASSIDERFWYRAKSPVAGQRTLLASVEPIVVICITKKINTQMEDIKVSQKFYEEAWSGEELKSSRKSSIQRAIIKRTKRSARVYLALRNIMHLLGISFGFRDYSLVGNNFERVNARSLRGD